MESVPKFPWQSHHFFFQIPEGFLVGGFFLGDVALVAVLPAGEVEVPAPGTKQNNFQ